MQAAGYFVADGVIPANDKAVARLIWTFREYVRDQRRLEAYLTEERNERILYHYLTIDSKTGF